MRGMEIGVMTWVGGDPIESIRWVKSMGIKTMQLGCPPDEYLSGEKMEEVKRELKTAGIKVSTVFCGYEGESYRDFPTIKKTVGLVNPESREERIKKTFEISDFAKELGVNVVGAHIGFIPEDSKDPLYTETVETMRKIADYCKSNGQYFSLETGMETANTLLRFIKDVGRDNLRVNFDPANIIIYGTGDPIEALEIVKDYVIGVHCKDAKLSAVEGVHARQVPLGQGDVGIERFVKKLKEIAYKGPLTIEREIRDREQQTRDVLEAKKLLEKLRNSL